MSTATALAPEAPALSPLRAALSQLSPVTEGRRYSWTEYDLAGLRWHTWGRHDAGRLSCHLEDGAVILEIDSDPRGGLRWQWSRQIAESVYARAYGRAETLADAAAQAAAFRPEILTCEYLGETVTWYQTRPDTWYAAIGGEAAEIQRFTTSGAVDEPYAWQRRCAAASDVLALVKNQNLGGRSASLVAAMRMCVDAPDLLRRACGALVAKLSSAPGAAAAGGAA